MNGKETRKKGNVTIERGTNLAIAKDNDEAQGITSNIGLKFADGTDKVRELNCECYNITLAERNTAP